MATDSATPPASHARPDGRLEDLDSRCGALRTMLDDVSQLIDSALAAEARIRRELDNTQERIRELMKEES